MAKSKDLFDDSAMSFGEHLEALRMHLWKAIIGALICVVGCLFFAKHIVAVLEMPLERGLQMYHFPDTPYDKRTGFDIWDWSEHKLNLDLFPKSRASTKTGAPVEPPRLDLPKDTIEVRIKAIQLYSALKDVAPASVKDTNPPPDDATLTLLLTADEFEELSILRDSKYKPKSFSVQESFMVFLKVALISGVVIAAPWIFFQIWLFVAAGLYPHEKKYVYRYLPMSVGLFFVGVAFCFFAVIPLILRFLLSFNDSMGIEPVIRLSEWLTFAILLPAMFGISFQLPLIMLFLERISIFTADDYRRKRRISILVISIVTMFLTPPDPGSMIAMMFPLLFLYEFGIILCRWSPAKATPFEEAPA
jgi:sec-independent protein translocase protein TatC